MVHGKRRSFSRGGGRGLPSARVQWLGSADNDIVGSLVPGTTFQRDALYDFALASSAGDKHGGGDWTIERIIFSAGVVSNGAAQTRRMAVVCFGLGLLAPATGVGIGTISQTQLPSLTPDASWMVRVCCYINLASLEVERCEIDGRAKRRISPETKLVWSVDTPTILVGSESIGFEADARILLRQRGSRV